LSWGLGNPALLTVCYKDGKPDPDNIGPIDPTLNSSWIFLKDFFQEVADVFTDDYLHLG
jgi:hexosaminidase